MLIPHREVMGSLQLLTWHGLQESRGVHRAEFLGLEAFDSTLDALGAAAVLGPRTCSSGELRRLDSEGDARHHHRGCVGPNDEHQCTRSSSTGPGTLPMGHGGSIYTSVTKGHLKNVWCNDRGIP